MTIEERNEIFSKEYLSIADVQKLFGFQYDKAAEYIRTAKRALTFSDKYERQGVRLDANGKLHVQDYLDYIGVSANRYNITGQNETKNSCVII